MVEPGGRTTPLGIARTSISVEVATGVAGFAPLPGGDLLVSFRAGKLGPGLFLVRPD
jgi:hypothetical protein